VVYLSVVRRSYWILLVGVVGAVLAPSPVAQAATVVSGDRDTGAPLVIDPGVSGGEVGTLGVSSPKIVGLIRRMPVTKRVEAVTIGNFHRFEDCPAGGGSYTLTLKRYASDRWVDQEGSHVESTSHSAMSTSPGRVRFELPDTTLVKDKAYTFSLKSNFNSCTVVGWETWPHNQAQVDGGPQPDCANAWEFAASINYMRVWHVKGQNEAPTCFGATVRNFDPSMPTGWLLVNNSHTMEIQAQTSPGDCSASYGLAAQAWRTPPAPPYGYQYDRYICTFNQYTAPESEPLADGWYSASQFEAPQTDGKPRDTYLQLHTIDYDALLPDFAPTLFYDTDELFRAISPGAATDYYSGGGVEGDSNQLKDAAGAFAIADPIFTGLGSGRDLLTLGYLGERYPAGSGRRSGQLADSGDQVSERSGSDSPHGDDGYIEEHLEMHARAGYPNRLYSRAGIGGNGKVWLQYWIFYYWDGPNSILGDGSHEGDWEMVQVGLDSLQQPDTVAFAQHGHVQHCDWDQVETAWGTHPKVFVADDSHASLPHASSGSDDADGEGAQLLYPTIEPIDATSPSWIAWPGKWGDSDTSPPGPYFQGATKWHDPSAWAGPVTDCSPDP